MARRRVPTGPPVRLGADECRRLESVGLEAGLDRVGICSAAPWTRTRDVIESRREAGLAGGLEFTYRKPARSADPTRVMKRASTLIVGARSYAQVVESPEVPDGRVRVARYATADHYGHLRDALGTVAAELRGMGARAVVLADDNAVVDREAAWRAGIGWSGKSSLVLSPGLGSWVVLGSVVTDATLGADAPVATPVRDGCGTCDRCMPACPTGAIVAPGVVDARRCLAALVQLPGAFPSEHRVALGNRLYGCDDCQEACPPSRAVELRTARRPDAPVHDDPGAWVDPCELLALDDDALLERCGRWYVPGRDPRMLRRNLLLVIGNSASPTDPRAAALVARYRDGDDELLAEHAAWADRRLTRRRDGSDLAGPPHHAAPDDVLVVAAAGDEDGAP